MTDAARDRAQQLYQAIVKAGMADDHSEVVMLIQDPETEDLLELLPEADLRRAAVHISIARRWAHARRKRNAAKLAEAKAALDHFDLELARGLVALLDERFLDEEAEQQRDRLLLDIEARRMELAPLRRAQEELPPSRSDDTRPWWRRRGR